MNKICFIITSVISPWNDEPFGYSAKRTIYDAQQRYEQTLSTINSIRKYNGDDVTIWLLEGGKTIDTQEFENCGVRVFNVSRIKYIKKAVMSNSKAWGEASMMMYALPFMIKEKFDLFFKISGRYSLNEHFDICQWSLTNISGKDIYGDKQELSTRLFCIPKHQIFNFYKALLSRWWKLKGSGTVYENYLVRHIGPENISWINPIGVEGKIGVSGKKVIE